MKKHKLILALVALTLAGTTAWAQSPGMRGGPGITPAIGKLFGNNTSFSTKATVTMDSDGKTITMEMDLAMLDGKMRMETDLTKAKGIPPGGIESMKQMGMDIMVNIDRPDKKVSLVVFPSMKAYSETPFDTTRIKSEAGDFKIEKTTVGSETIDGHPCKRSKLVITDGSGEKHEAMAWYAVDLKDFPLQILMNQDDATMKMRFTKIRLEKPDAKSFDAPAGFTKYGSQTELMSKEMIKRRNQAQQQKEP
jgi:hypothetical protein